MTRNDVLWKGLIEDMFPSFIPFFLPEYQHLFDLKKPVAFLDKEFQQLYPQPNNDEEVRFVDKLVKVHTIDGKEKWVLIHVEVQGYNDPGFSERMYTYFYRILDRYKISVTAIAIFTDGNRSFAPDHYTYDFAGTTNIYRFNIYKVLAQNEQQLEKSDNPFAIAILTVLLALQRRKLEDGDLLRLKIDLIMRLRNASFSQAIIRSLFGFIRRYVNFAKPETKAIFEKELESLTNNHQPMGVFEMVLQMEKQEARIEGRQEQMFVFVENLLHSTDFTDEKVAFLAGVSLAFVSEIKEKLSSK